MENYLEVANSGAMYAVATIIVLFVLAMSGTMMLMAIKRGKEIGVTSKQVWAVVRSVSVMSVLSSISIALGFFTLAPILGIPVPWARLSIIGSYTVEASCAKVGAAAAGAAELGGAGFTAEAFAAAVWAMTFGTLWYLLVTPFALKKLKTSVSKSTGKDQKWAAIFGNSIMISLIGIFAAQDFIKGGDARLTVIISGLITVAMGYGMMKCKKLSFLKEFGLPFTLIACMIIMCLLRL